MTDELITKRANLELRLMVIHKQGRISHQLYNDLLDEIQDAYSYRVFKLKCSGGGKKSAAGLTKRQLTKRSKKALKARKRKRGY